MSYLKRGLSPVIATILLISIALVLAIIIFLWAKSFMGEKIQKDLGEGPEPIEGVCEKVYFGADARLSSGLLEVDVVNKGNVPIYKMEIRKKGKGSVQSLGTFVLDYSGASLLSGQTRSLDGAPAGGVAADEKIILVPVILGESSDYARAYVCEGQGVETTVA